MKLIDEIYDNEKDIANFFSTIDWSALGVVLANVSDAIKEMPEDKAHKLAFDLFLVVSCHLNINVFEVLKKE